MITLFAHPASRPFLTLCFKNVPTHGRSGSLEWNERLLHNPVSLEDAALWMLVGAQKTEAHRTSNQELQSLLDIASKAEPSDSDNAFWRQMSAVFLNAMGESEAAEAMWRRAATLAKWDDWQTPELRRRAAQLAGESGGSMAWQDAYLYTERSNACAAAIRDYVVASMTNPGGTKWASLQTRYATLVNGELIRDGARSVAIGNIGADIVEISSHSGTLARSQSYRKLFVARFEFKEALRKAGLNEEALNSERVFNDNDGWTALTHQGQSRESRDLVFIGAVVLATLPSALVLSALVGLTTFLMGLTARRIPRFEACLRFPWSMIWAMFFGSIVGLITQFPLAGLAAGLCGIFVSMSPKHERSVRPASMGPLFSIVIVILAIMLVSIVCAFGIGLTTPAVLVLPKAGIPQEYLAGSSLYIGLGALAFGALLLVAPLWAFAQRVRTSHVLIEGVILFGSGMLAISLVAAVILCPVCVYGDRKLGATVRELFLNEPLHYLRQ